MRHILCYFRRLRHIVELSNVCWGAGATRGYTSYIYIQIHRSGISSVNHTGNWQLYMLKYCTICL